MRKWPVGSFIFGLIAWPLFFGAHAAAFAAEQDIYLPPNYHTFVLPLSAEAI